jgi:hypothetical protein
VLQAAFDALPAEGGQIYIRRAVYTVAVTLTVSRANTRVFGETTGFGTGGSVIKAGAALVGNLLTASPNFFQIEHLYLDGNGVASQGLRLGGWDAQAISCIVMNCDTGIFAKSNTWIENCWIEYNVTYGIYVYPGEYVWIVDSMFYSNGAHDIAIEGTASGAPRRAVWVCFNRFYDTPRSVDQWNTIDALICIQNHHFSMSYQCYRIEGTINWLEIIGDVVEGDSDTENFIRVEAGANVVDGYVRDYHVANLLGAVLSNAGTFEIRFKSVIVPFVSGTDPQDSGFLINAAGEFARAWTFLPRECRQVIRAKVYARSAVLEADSMLIDFSLYGGADNEPYTTHDGSIVSCVSTSVNFAADDIIYWTITTAELLAMQGGDSIQIRAEYRAAAVPNCETNAYIRTLEIEYI